MKSLGTLADSVNFFTHHVSYICIFAFDKVMMIKWKSIYTEITTANINVNTLPVHIHTIMQGSTNKKTSFSVNERAETNFRERERERERESGLEREL